MSAGSTIANRKAGAPRRLRGRRLAQRSFDETARAGAGGPARTRSGGGRLTLEQRLDSVWEGLHAAGAADCPICHGRLELAAGVARCCDCGSSLA